ncbi:MAG TPA: ABC transporter [Syntrophomonas sp.]|nr:ABC transporter [Syntrophomonas sp.]
MLPIINVTGLHYTYLPGTPYEREALKDINFSLQRGELLGVFGPNGSGKSTLVQHLNGLLYPTRGSVTVCAADTSDRQQRRELWKKVSLVFQYPEQQIFGTTVWEEIAYGPKNLGLDDAEINDRVKKAMQQVGLLPEDSAGIPPYSLSGGMKRRVAIAGLLATDPEILILDEPMAGLDPAGRSLILDIIKHRHDNSQTTVMISHNLQDIMALADKVAILHQGSLVFFGAVSQLLKDKEILSRYHLELPDYLQVIYSLQQQGYMLNSAARSIAEAAKEMARLLGSKL